MLRLTLKLLDGCMRAVKKERYYKTAQSRAVTNILLVTDLLKKIIELHANPLVIVSHDEVFSTLFSLITLLPVSH